MKKILFITMHDPGTSSGGGLATRSYLEALCSLSEGQIDICLADNCKIEKEDINCVNLFRVPKRSQFSRLMSIFTGEMHRFTKYVKKLLKNNYKDYFLCVFDVSYIGGTLVDYVNSLGIKTATIHHNYQPTYFWDNRSSFFIRDYIFLSHIKRVERKSYMYSQFNLFLTQPDLLLFEKTYGFNNKRNGVIGTFEFKEGRLPVVNDNDKCLENKLKLVISGSLSSVQTLDALDYFFKDLYPKISDEFDVIITGRDPSSKLIQISEQDKNITLYPNPVDIASIISKGDIYLCPTRLGGGLKLRVMDGLKSGLPIITHSVSARGYEYFEKENFFFVFDTPEEFLDSLLKLKSQIKDHQFLRRQIQESYLSYFSFSSGLKRIARVLDLDNKLKLK